MMDELDTELQAVDQHLVSLSRRVEPDPRHKAQLRQELVRRHRELNADNTQRAAGTLWSRLTGLKRLTLVAPPALAVLVAVSLAIFGLPIGTHQSPQAAMAQRLTYALARTAPTVTAWQVNVQQERGDSAGSAECGMQKGQHLFIRDGRAYLYTGGRWYQVTTLQGQADGQCPLDLQWASAVLPARLSHGQFSVVPGKVIQGRATDGIRFQVLQSTGSVTTTLWVDRTSGLVLQAQRVVIRNQQVVERDFADYSYTRSQ